MVSIKEQLKNLVNLANYVNNCPISCRLLIIKAETQRADDYLKNSDLHPEIELRCYQLQEKIKTDNLLCIYEERSCISYIKKSIAKKQDCGIENLHELILGRCLSSAVARHLDNIKEIHPFSTDEVLASAFQQYKTILYRETLYFFEIMALIERHKHLADRKQALSPHTPGHVTDTFVPELKFIEKKLGIEEREKFNLIDFKLRSTQALLEYLSKLGELSLVTLDEKYRLFISNEGTNSIYLGLDTESTLKGPNNEDFFAAVPAHLQQSIVSVEKFLENATTHLTQSTMPAPAVITQDRRLQELRETVAHYREQLQAIEENEKKTYVKRNTRLLENRKKALTSLEQCINQEAKLTLSMKHVVSQLITEINLNKPHWSELALLKKILDIISIGLNALIRYNTFKEHESEKNLTKQIEKITKPNDDDEPHELESQL